MPNTELSQLVRSLTVEDPTLRPVQPTYWSVLFDETVSRQMDAEIQLLAERVDLDAFLQAGLSRPMLAACFE